MVKMSRNIAQPVNLPSMLPSNITGPGHYFATNTGLLEPAPWPASHAHQPQQLFYPYQQNALEPLFPNPQFGGDSRLLAQQAFVNEQDENLNYLHGTLNPPTASDQDTYYQQQQGYTHNGGSSPNHQVAGSPSGSEEADGSPAETVSNDGMTVEGDDDNDDDDDDDGEGSTSKLEKSRQSARECRARKKLRYQYLESLVDARKQSVAQLKDELAQFELHAKVFDQGDIPPGLMELLDDKTTVSSRQVETNAPVKARLNKVSSRSSKAAADTTRRPPGRPVDASNRKSLTDAAAGSLSRTKRLKVEHALLR